VSVTTFDSSAARCAGQPEGDSSTPPPGAGADLGALLAQRVNTHPPTSIAEPISASRRTSNPVNGRPPLELEPSAAVVGSASVSETSSDDAAPPEEPPALLDVGP
jgi:hypothetical protein